MRVILYTLGQVTTYPLVVWPKFKLPIVIWNLTLYPPKVSLVRVLLPNSVKNKGKYVILLHLYVFLLQKYKKKKLQEKQDQKLVLVFLSFHMYIKHEEQTPRKIKSKSTST